MFSRLFCILCYLKNYFSKMSTKSVNVIKTVENAKESVKKTRISTEKLRDILRKNCFARIHKARQMQFEENRGKSLKDLKDLSLKDIIREELSELKEEIDLQEKILAEMENELNEWILEQHIEEEKYLCEIAEDNSLVCPMCQKNTLVANNNTFECACKSSFIYAGTMQELWNDMNTKINKHEQSCTSNLTFFIELENNEKRLRTFCIDCDFYAAF